MAAVNSETGQLDRPQNQMLELEKAVSQKNSWEWDESWLLS